jgi:adenylosuccinate lyase
MDIVDEIDRDMVERSSTAVGKVSGAVGTLVHLDAATEEGALARLGLTPEPVATQVVQRDRHAALLGALAVLAGSFERIAVEIRHLQRTEVREASEPFDARQKGSSAMPHKRNPIRTERVSGLARLVRGYAQAAFENQALWHERDISHSSAERVLLPDAFLVLDFMGAELADVLERLEVREVAMRRNLEAGGGLVYSQRVLLALTDAGLARDDAYGIVQEHALAAADGGPDFKRALAADPRVRARLDPGRLEKCFTLDDYLRSVEAIFARAHCPEGVEALR